MRQETGAIFLSASDNDSKNPVNKPDMISATLLLMYKSNIYEKFIFKQGMNS